MGTERAVTNAPIVSDEIDKDGSVLADVKNNTIYLAVIH